MPFTPFVVIAGGRKVLIDTGLGEFGGPNAGKLLENLRAAGVPASDIDTVLISHFHGDHINGPAQQGGRTGLCQSQGDGARSRVRVLDGRRQNGSSPCRTKGAFENARRTFSAMGPDMLVQFAAGAEVVPASARWPLTGTPQGTLCLK